MEDWIDATEEQAYAVGVSVEEYGRLQPHELRKIFDAHKQKQKDADYRTAYFLSWLVNLQVTKPIEYTKIADPLYITEEERQGKLAEERAAVFEEFGLDKKEG